jgi:hypothetical protein
VAASAVINPGASPWHSVEGVSIAGGTNGSAINSYVVGARPLSDSGTGNALLVRGTGETLSSPTSVAFLHDNGTCNQPSAFVPPSTYYAPAGTPYSAPSMSWCFDCGALVGFSHHVPSNGGCF